MLATRPGDAKIFLDGKEYDSRSPYFYLLPLRMNRISLGEHSIKIQKDGYETWEGVFMVEPGIVAWANYILLVPEKREAAPYNFSGDLTQTVTSEDRTRILALSKNNESKILSIYEVNTSSRENRRIYEIKLADGENIGIADYSESKNRILLEKTKDNVKTQYVIDVNNAGKEWNIQNLFRLNFGSYSFNPRNENELYVIKDKNLFSIDYSGGRMSAVLASDIVGIYPDEGNLYFIQNVEGNYGLWRLEQNNTKTNIVKSLPVSTDYQIKYLAEINAYAILSKKDTELYLYTIENGTPVLKRIAEKVSWFLASPRSKYISYYKEGSLINYDPEKDMHHTCLKDREIQSLVWLTDEANLIYLEGDKVSFINYNGYYDQFLFKAQKSIPVNADIGTNNIFFGDTNKDKNTLDLFSFSL